MTRSCSKPNCEIHKQENINLQLPNELYASAPAIIHKKSSKQKGSHITIGGSKDRTFLDLLPGHALPKHLRELPFELRRWMHGRRLPHAVLGTGPVHLPTTITARSGSDSCGIKTSRAATTGRRSSLGADSRLVHEGFGTKGDGDGDDGDDGRNRRNRKASLCLPRPQ